MFPNLRAEMARKNITVRRLHELLNANGIKISLSQLSMKLSGKYNLTLPEADAIRGVLEVDIPLEILFEREGA